MNISYLRICDTCCDKSGTAKELIKSGGCTCDICGWSCGCCRDAGKQFINKIPIRLIPENGWRYLQSRNEESLQPLDFQSLMSEERDH